MITTKISAKPIDHTAGMRARPCRDLASGDRGAPTDGHAPHPSNHDYAA
ncbi:MAG: hypothetical protein OIF47_00780 [Marinibacterium sp.]|nr:hypothetical protein [Marinibacterium sp.]